MPHFMVSCNYSAESKNAMIANPVDRTKAASAAVEAVGGKLHSAFMTFGETDIIVIYEAPDFSRNSAIVKVSEITAGGKTKRYPCALALHFGTSTPFTVSHRASPNSAGKAGSMSQGNRYLATNAGAKTDD